MNLQFRYSFEKIITVYFCFFFRRSFCTMKAFRGMSDFPLNLCYHCTHRIDFGFDSISHSAVTISFLSRKNFFFNLQGPAIKPSRPSPKPSSLKVNVRSATSFVLNYRFGCKGHFDLINDILYQILDG